MPSPDYRDDSDPEMSPQSTEFQSAQRHDVGAMLHVVREKAWVIVLLAVAGLLLAGLLYDTLILRSPTSTARDERVAAELAEITGEDIEQYGQELFVAAAADLSARSPELLLTADFKEFTVGDKKIAIGTVETASPVTIEKRTPELLSTMQRLAQERGYSSFLFMIVDIINMQCRLLVWGGERAVADVLRVPLEADGHTLVVDNLVSRKKQLVPLLGRIRASMQENNNPL